MLSTNHKLSCDHASVPVNVFNISQSWPFNFNVNWESNSKYGDQFNTKADWNDQKHSSNANYDNYDMQCGRKYASNKSSRVRQKSPLYYCQMDDPAIHPKCDSSYKSYDNYYALL